MLNLKINKELPGCSILSIYDTTGLFSENNEDGWNGDNLSRIDVTEATIKITTPIGGVYEEDVTSVVNDSTYPKYLIYSLEPNQLIDGIYIVTFIVKSETEEEVEEYTVTESFKVTCGVECCVSKLAASVANELCNNCESEARKKFSLAYELLAALKSGCLTDKQFNKMLTQLQTICNSTNCGC